MSVRLELDAGDCGVVLTEGDEALAVERVPHFDFAVFAASGYVEARGRVGHLGHVVEVALLLEHVGLALPFPYEQLAESFARQCDPIAAFVEYAACNRVF